MRDNIINLVDRIIEGKKSGIDMRELEEEVDRLVLVNTLFIERDKQNVRKALKALQEG